MDYMQRWFSNIKYVYNSMNPAVLSGAIDVIVIEQPDNTLKCSPFYVRFGKIGVFNSSEKYVDIRINDKDVDIRMKLGENGLAYFHDSRSHINHIYHDQLKQEDDHVASAVRKTFKLEQKLLSGMDENTDVSLKRCPSLAESTSTSGFSSAGSEDELYEPDPVLRSFRISSDKLRQLGLKYGQNDAKFSITTRLQGTTASNCHIYLYKWTDKIVISDIDGTITRSDVLGHIIPAIGGQWAHTGVTELYSAIRDNGYKIIYLSSRAIGQSSQTKAYLQSVIQGSKTLPAGPVLISCTSLFMAFKKEVIERNPQEFKIACLTDVKSLFPVEDPFFAGFGNRDTDIQSYRAVDIPKHRIIIINPTGLIKTALETGYHSSYINMVKDTVDYMFPPLPQPHCTNAEELELNSKFVKPHTFSNLTHWRKPNDLTIEDRELERYERERLRRQKENLAKQPKKRRFFGA
ncbi:unnamed protein product [Bursaphelenchus okinawaensis]|uniref:LNS2/PITP domain-containing protein n=1 Tax=Bursaphelenchus okinawaensis TaxID=465554 RepID=A0A811LN62_9BILA|nr:unnamed protein product [Bursaphelenchus okinawaensis]CAG9125948.1 unnamed protein product [Bursaphelenchus okinawaensis]